MASDRTCPHCHRAALRRPPAWAPLAVASAWLFVAVMLFLSALIGPFIMFAVPVIFAFGAAAVRSAHDFAFALPSCEACGKLVPAEATTSAPAEERELALARAA